MTRKRPTGRDEVRDALIEAAARHFAERGTKAPVRDIAADANVNLGLFSRHFGTKENLLRAVVERSTVRGADAIAEVSAPGDAVRRLFMMGAGGNRDVVRTMAWALLEGHGDVAGPDRYPTIERLRTLAGADDDPDAELRLIAAMAMLQGWALFSGELLTWFDHGPDDRADIEERLGELLRGFVDDA